MGVQMQPSDLTQADRDEVNEHLARWIQACKDRDWDQLLDQLVTEDVIFLPPDDPICNGRAEVRAYLEEFPEILEFAASLTSFHGRGDMAIGQGTFDFTVSVDGESVNAIGKWLASYRKTTDGWKIVQDIWNNDSPAA